jgi:hypothetical protein
MFYEEAIKYGFSLNNEFIAIDSHTSNYINFVELKNKLLFSDLRKKPCLNAYFPSEINNQHGILTLKGTTVLQILSISNISNPSKRKYENSNPRLLSIQVTDGTTKVTGIEIESILDIQSDTPPGTKILYKGGEAINGKLLFNNKNISFIGGEVSHLFFFLFFLN